MRKKLSHLVNTYLTDKLPYTFHATDETRPITNHIDCNSKNVMYMIQCNDCSKQYVGETKRRLKDRFNEHRRSVDNPSTISKPTTVSEHFLTNDHSANDITLIAKSSRDSVGKAREAYLIERGKTLEPLGMNTVFISSICYHLFILFLHFKFLSNHYINGFCFQRSLFSHFTFTCYYSIKLHAILYFKLKRPILTSSLCERP